MSTGSNNEEKHFSIGQASTETGVKQTVLRFWETEFDILSPKKNKFGHRVYYEDDIKTILKIKKLLYEEGMTIKGAKHYIEKHNTPGEPGVDALVNAQIIRKKLLELRDLLKNN